MITNYSIAEARKNFSAIIRDVERMAVVKLTRRGKPVAILVSPTEYEHLLTGRQSFWDSYQAFLRRVDVGALDISPVVFEGLRDDAPGREAIW